MGKRRMMEEDIEEEERGEAKILSEKEKGEEAKLFRAGLRHMRHLPRQKPPFKKKTAVAKHLPPLCNGFSDQREYRAIPMNGKADPCCFLHGSKIYISCDCCDQV